MARLLVISESIRGFRNLISERLGESDMDIEAERRRLMALVFTIIGIPTLYAFSMARILEGRYDIGLPVLAVAVLMTAVNVRLVRVHRPLRVFRLVLLVATVLFLALMSWGGRYGELLLWMYVAPPLVFFMLDRNEALVWIAAIFCLAEAVLWMPSDVTGSYPYPEPVAIRFTATFIIVSCISLVGEILRSEIYGAFQVKKDNLSRRTADLNQTVEQLDREIQERKKAEERIRYLAYHDDLTGLANRALFREILSRTLASTRRHHGIAAVLFIDVDNFKHVNDTLGHTAGDALLKTVARRITTCIRDSDALGRMPSETDGKDISRLGGDEFAVLLSEMAHSGDAAHVASRIMEAMAEPFMLSDLEVFVSLSIGIALYPDDGTEIDTLLKNADMAMYHAKKQGRNNYQFFSSSLHAAAHDRLTLQNDLRRALEREEFIPYFQPIIDVESRAVIGMEALLRWQHPERGLVYPGSFIALAEETGLIGAIGEWMLAATCRQLRRFHKAGFTHLRAAVNLSSRQFEQPDLAVRILFILETLGVSPASIELEITESTLMSNPDRAIETLGRLKEKGVATSVDDFGTGYSSLSYLRKLPLDALKVDRSFIGNVVRNKEDATITATIVGMAHTLGLKVVAEGVETEEQRGFLAALGCDRMQGYLIGRPMPPEEFMKFLSAGVPHAHA